MNRVAILSDTLLTGFDAIAHTVIDDEGFPGPVGEDMQQRPRGPHPMDFYSTEPLPPEGAPSIVPALAPPQGIALQPSPKKRQDHNWHTTWRVLLKMSVLGALLEGVYVGLYPLFAGFSANNKAAVHALLGLFSWLPRLYWTTSLPWLVHAFARIPAFDVSRGGVANMLALFLALAFVLVLLAALVGNKPARERLSSTHTSVIFYGLIFFTVLFTLTYFCAPAVASQDMFLYGLYSRIVIVYHVNPYLVPATAFPNDILQPAVLSSMHETMLHGPVWIDLSILVTLFAHSSIENILLDFRVLGLLAHVCNVMLIWAILGKLKPGFRISGTLLYAWNPLILLMSVAEVHAEVVIVLFVLLAVFLLQRKSLLLSWVFLLLAALINPLAVLLLPLFLRLLFKEARAMGWGVRVLWGLGMAGVSLLVVVLAYTPYWHGWGLTGITDMLRQAFVPDGAINSLDAALLKLPLRLPLAVAWLVAPQHWAMLGIFVMGGILLFGLWLGDTVALVLLFTSWLSLALVVFEPTYWPWYTLLPLALAICSTGRGTMLLAILLAMGGALCYYYWFWQPAWSGQALVTIGLPLLVWGWTLFFTSTWGMTHPDDGEAHVIGTKGSLRPAWISRPSWPFGR